ncbi:hypothetical protein FQV26_07825 [Planococcus sp. CPCC 101016]|uniref:hypothetical protein n=1 Tax=Planococcus sp. CPCC 101016 TaxID=2599617 RepID=UPI0011B74E2B|nr:hypothetical protein [Planococcus sp. CPCC 101016]TWT07708.1 hypothetical protein FQV26_07825 [Planococcus sp. CPCC 101016]
MNSFLDRDKIEWLFGSPEIRGLVIVYAAILLLMTCEWFIRKKTGQRFRSGTAEGLISFWAKYLRLFLVVCALPLLTAQTAFVLVMFLGTLSANIFVAIYYLKWLCFSVLFLLIVVKAFYERKLLSGKIYLVTLGSGITTTGLLYYIYTFWF